MKKMLLLPLLLSLSLNAFAQEEPDPETPEVAPASRARVRVPRAATSATYQSVGVGYMVWNEDLRLQQSGVVTSAPANYQGASVNFQSETIYRRWGWSVAGFIGSGRANAGDAFDAQVPYTQAKQAWTLLGASPRVFYRLTGRVNMGLSVPLMMKMVEWPAAPGMTIDSGKKMITSGAFDFSIRLNNKWDLYQGIGALSNDSSTMWRVSLNYRL